MSSVVETNIQVATGSLRPGWPNVDKDLSERHKILSAERRQSNKD